MKKEEYYLRLERAIDYIEKNLNQKIELGSISKHAFSSLSHFHRIFYFMTGITLKDYVRRRRLSNAAIQLLQSGKSIIDIAHETLYETPESFNKSFKKMYLFSPTEFRKKRPEFEITRKLELTPNEYVQPPKNISLNFVYLPEQIAAGFKIRTTLENNQQTKDIPKFFIKVMDSNLLLKIPNVLDNKKIFGIYSDMTDEEEFDYTVGLLAEKPVKNSSGICYHLLPATEYARFTVQGSADELENAWRYIYGAWFPTSGRSRQKGLDFEIYYPDKADIYIPMVSEKNDTK